MRYIGLAIGMMVSVVIAAPSPSVSAQSMGSTGVATVWGMEALGYNPAGLAQKSAQWGFSLYDVDRQAYSSAQSWRYTSGRWGYDMTQWHTTANADIQVHRVSFGSPGQGPLDWGFAIKWMQIDAAGNSQNGLSSDVGFQLHIHPNIDAGLVVTDLFKQEFGQDMGAQAGVSIFDDARRWLLSTDIQWRQADDDHSDLLLGIGAEHRLDRLAIRTGFKENWASVGLGFLLGDLQVNLGTQIDMTDEQDNRLLASITLGQQLFRKHTPRLTGQNTVVGFRLNAALIAGKSSVGVLGGAKMGLNDVLIYLHRAVHDPRVDGILVRLGALNKSIATLGVVEEVRRELEIAKKAGKKVVVYLEGWAGLSEYYLASVADTIILPTMGSLSHLGLDLQVKKTTGLFNKIGIGYTTIQQGKYKASLNSTTPTLNADQRARLEDVVDGLYASAVDTIKQSRDLEWEEVGTLFDGRLIDAQTAQKLNLVDELGYIQLAKDALKATEPTRDPTIIGLDAFAMRSWTQDWVSAFSKIAIVEIDGTIGRGKNTTGLLFGNKKTGADQMVEVLQAIEKSNRIKGVIIRINSPGGGIIASDMLYEAVKKVAETKLVYISIGNIAASGGYYIALAGNKIFANTHSLTGSIGVVSSFRNMAEFNEKFGIGTEHIKTGKYMDLYASDRDMTEQERAMLVEHQERIYNRFVSLIQANRDIEKSKIEELAQGQVMTGKQAQDVGLIDEIKTFNEIVDAMADELGLVVDPQLIIVRPNAKALGLRTLMMQRIKSWMINEKETIW